MSTGKRYNKGQKMISTITLGRENPVRVDHIVDSLQKILEGEEGSKFRDPFSEELRRDLREYLQIVGTDPLEKRSPIAPLEERIWQRLEQPAPLGRGLFDHQSDEPLEDRLRDTCLLGSDRQVYQSKSLAVWLMTTQPDGPPYIAPSAGENPPYPAKNEMGFHTVPHTLLKDLVVFMQREAPYPNQVRYAQLFAQNVAISIECDELQQRLKFTMPTPRSERRRLATLQAQEVIRGAGAQLNQNVTPDPNWKVTLDRYRREELPPHIQRITQLQQEIEASLAEIRADADVVRQRTEQLERQINEGTEKDKKLKEWSEKLKKDIKERKNGEIWRIVKTVGAIIASALANQQAKK